MSCNGCPSDCTVLSYGSGLYKLALRVLATRSNGPSCYNARIKNLFCAHAKLVCAYQAPLKQSKALDKQQQKLQRPRVSATEDRALSFLFCLYRITLARTFLSIQLGLIWYYAVASRMWRSLTACELSEVGSNFSRDRVSLEPSGIKVGFPTIIIFLKILQTDSSFRQTASAR